MKTLAITRHVSPRLADCELTCIDSQPIDIAAIRGKISSLGLGERWGVILGDVFPQGAAHQAEHVPRPLLAEPLQDRGDRRRLARSRRAADHRSVSGGPKSFIWSTWKPLSDAATALQLKLR